MLGSLAATLPVLLKRYLVESMAGEVKTSGAACISRETTSDHGDSEVTSGRALALDAVEVPADSSGREALLWPADGLMAAGPASGPPIKLIQPRWLRSFSLIRRLLLAELDSETPQDQSLPSCGVVGFSTSTGYGPNCPWCSLSFSHTVARGTTLLGSRSFPALDGRVQPLGTTGCYRLVPRWSTCRT